METGLSNCTNCGRSNGFLKVGQSGTHGVPLCLDCYVKLQSIELQQAEYNYRMLYVASNELEDMFGGLGGRVTPLPLPPRIAPVNTTYNNINVSNSQIGALNTGSISTVDASVTVLRGSGNQPVANDLKSLAEAVIQSGDLDPAKKNEILELLGAISTEATAPKDKQRKSMIKLAMARITDLLGGATSLESMWGKLKHLFESLFG